jgi:hypothetical protein
LQSGGNKGILDLIYNGKFRGPSPRCGGPVARSIPRWTTGSTVTGRSGALPLRGARVLWLAGACRLGATRSGGHAELDGLTGVRAAALRSSDGSEERQWLQLVARVKEGARGLGREGKRWCEVRGWCSPFIGAGGSAGEGWPGGNGGVNVFNAIEDGEVKGRVKEGVLVAGRVKARGSHSRRGAGRREVAGRGGIQRRRSQGRPAWGGRRS